MLFTIEFPYALMRNESWQFLQWQNECLLSLSTRKKMDLTCQALLKQNNSKLVFVCTRTEYGFAIHFTMATNGIKISCKLCRTEKVTLKKKYRHTKIQTKTNNQNLKLVVVCFRKPLVYLKISNITVYSQLSQTKWSKNHP